MAIIFGSCSPGSLGDPCNGSDLDCVEDLFCDNESHRCTSDESGECRGHDSDCLGDLVCREYVCVTTSTVDYTTIGGIRIKWGTADSEGRINFTDDQTREDVPITTVQYAEVVFIDGDGFETFIPDHPNSPPVPFVRAHNSGHELNLSTSSTQSFLYTGSSNSNSKEAARRFYDFVKEHSREQGCETVDDLILDTRRRISALGDVSGRVQGAGAGRYVASFGVKAIDSLIYLKDVLRDAGATRNDCQAYRTWTTEGVSSWNISPSRSLEIDTYDCMTSIPDEINGDGIDNDCDGETDEEGECASPSPYHNECLGTSSSGLVGVYNACGELVDTFSCNPDEICLGGECIEDEPGCIPENDTFCYDGNVRWVDSCDVPGGVAQYCYTDQVCRDLEEGAECCTLEDYLGCEDNTVTWFDSCDVPGEGLETCATSCSDGECVDEPVCNPASGCPEANCVFYDDFDSELDPCHWWASSDDIEPSGGTLTFDATDYTSDDITSVLFPSCTNYNLVFRLRLSSTNGSWSVGGGLNSIHLYYTGSINEISLNCNGYEPTLDSEISNSTATSWHDIEIIGDETGLDLYINDVFQGRRNNSCEINGFSIQARVEGELNLDYIMISCYD